MPSTVSTKAPSLIFESQVKTNALVYLGDSFLIKEYINFTVKNY